jgi:hypothetical protein
MKIADKHLCVRISKTFKSTFSEYFETEELTFFAPLKNKSDLLLKLCSQLIDEHQQLHPLVQDLSNHPEYLLTFGNLLKSHSRLEDRQLFPKVDLLSDSEKLAIIKPSSCHTPVVRI